MSLRTKLFASFVVMILLTVVTAGVSMMASREIRDSVENSRSTIDYVAGGLVPVSGKWTTLSNQITSAGLGYYSYAHGFIEKDFDNAEREVTGAGNELAELRTLLSGPYAEDLKENRAVADDCAGSVGDLKRLGNEIRDSRMRLNNLNANFGKTQEEVTAIADVQYQAAFSALKDWMDRKEAAPEEAGRRSADVEFISDVFDCIVWGNTAFWQAQSMRGEAAKKCFDEMRGHMEALIERVDGHNNPENVPDADRRGQFSAMREVAQRLIGISDEIQEISSRIDGLTGDIDSISDKAADRVRGESSLTARHVLENTLSIRSDSDRIRARVDASGRTQLAVLAVAVLGGMLLAYFITRGIVNPIDGAINELSSGQEVLASASDSIGEASRSLAQASGEQASSLQETSSALEEIAAMSKVSSDNAAKTRERTTDTMRIIGDGMQSMRAVTTSMADISEKSGRIGEIVKTIQEIAFQTNLLALNAAVEAARAGEAGKGFAVVADEVRSLAQRSATAAKETTELIEGTVASIRTGAGLTDRLASSYGEIEKGTGGISGLVEQISTAATEQTHGIEQVNQAMGSLDRVTQRNSASSEETAAAAEELRGQIGSLEETVMRLAELVHGSRQAAMAEVGEKLKKAKKRRGVFGRLRRRKERRVMPVTVLEEDGF